jgi:hypothetical protein
LGENAARTRQGSHAINVQPKKKFTQAGRHPRLYFRGLLKL